MNNVQILGFLILLASALFSAWRLMQERTAHHATRADLTAQITLFREQRDAVVRAVRWVPLKPAELTALAKTGCNNCHGKGMHDVNRGGGKRGVDVCFCVMKAISNRGDYGAMADGVPVRLATQAELDAILPNEKTGNVTPIRRDVTA